MQHLNFCRQLREQCERVKSWPNASAEQRGEAAHAIDLCRLSNKFMLPPDGRLLDDPEFRAIDETLPLRLPFDAVALEYDCPNSAAARRAILFCRQGEERVTIKLAYLARNDGFWYLAEDFGLPLTEYITRAQNGRAQFSVQTQGDAMRAHEQDGAQTLLGFLNALACSNVRMERSDPPKLKAQMRKALPFDSYHVLSIGGDKGPSETVAAGSHRSPREHLRRGHIRRLSSGAKIWVNATVVNPGIGGKVSKDYRVAA